MTTEHLSKTDTLQTETSKTAAEFNNSAAVDIKAISQSARKNILAKLNAEVAGADYDKLPQETPFTYPKLSKAEQVTQFCQHLEANHAQVINLESADISTVVAAQLKQRNISTLLYGNRSASSEHSICEKAYSESITSLMNEIELKAFDFTLDSNKSNSSKSNSNKEALFNDYPAAISSSRCAIAATGSIVLWPDENEPRTLSLVPPVHFVIVDANQLYADFATLIEEQQWKKGLPTNVVFISGPSKTADIQQTLAYGAHGPKELIVLLLNA